MRYGICTFAKGWVCTFCTKWQKWQKNGLWDLHFCTKWQVAKVAKEWVIGFSLFAQSGKKDLPFFHHVAKVAKEWVIGFALCAQSGKSGKMMGCRICSFCTNWHKLQKDGLWDLHFSHKVAKVAKGWLVGFALFAPIGKSGKRMGYGICTFCTNHFVQDGQILQPIILPLGAKRANPIFFPLGAKSANPIFLPLCAKSTNPTTHPFAPLCKKCKSHFVQKALIIQAISFCHFSHFVQKVQIL